MTDLVSRSTRGIFRDLMTDSTVGRIGAAFQDEGFAPATDCGYADTSVRRTTAQEYMESVDWTDAGQVARALRAIDRLLGDFEQKAAQRVWDALRRDGYVRDEVTGRFVRLGPELSLGSLTRVTDPSAIREQIDRLRRALPDDPALAVGTAKELVESTAKVVLTELGLPVDDRADLPRLARECQRALGLHPSGATPGPDGTDAVKRILGAVTTIAEGLAELRNRGYGTGHGPSTARVDLRPRHAHLAVNAAITWCQLVLDTLTDTEAPWRSARGRT